MRDHNVSSGMRGFGVALSQIGEAEMQEERTAQRNREMALADAEQTRWYGGMKTLVPELVRKNDPRITDFDKFYEDEWKIGEKSIIAHTHVNKAKKDKTNELIVQKELYKNNLKELWEKTNVEQEGMNFFANYKNDMTSSANYINEPDLIEHIVSIDVPAKEIQKDGRIEELSTPEQLRLIWRNNRTKKFSDYYLQRPDKVEKNEDGTKTVLKDYYIEHPNELVDKYMMRVEDNRELFGPEETAELKRQYNLQTSQRQAEGKKIAAEQTEKWRVEALIKLRNKQLTYKDVDNSPILTTGDLGRQEFYKLLDGQAKDTLKGEDIVSDKQIEAGLESMGYRLASGAVTKPQFDTAIARARYKDRKIDDSAFDQLASLGARKFESYQGDAMSEAVTHAQGQLVTVGESLLESLFAVIEDDKDRRTAEDMKNRRKLELDNLSRYRKSLNDWFKANPEADAEQIYIQSRKILAQYRTFTLPEIAQRREQFEKSLVPKERFGKPAGSAAYTPEGTAVGEYNADGTITLNIAGLRMLKSTTGGNKELARRIIKEMGYVIPEK